jgi:hypothetical protein
MFSQGRRSRGGAGVGVGVGNTGNAVGDAGVQVRGDRVERIELYARRRRAVELPYEGEHADQ